MRFPFVWRAVRDSSPYSGYNRTLVKQERGTVVRADASMTEEQVAALSTLAGQYVTAYFARMQIPEDDKPQLWSDPPVKAEYQAVLSFVRELEETSPQYSDKSIENFVDDLLQNALSNRERISDEVASLRMQIEHPLITQVYIPLDGATIEGQEMQIGAIRLI